jgi:GNAT superfamily N-acetyltransferase
MGTVHVREATHEDTESALMVLRRSITELCVADHQNDPQTLEHWLANKTPERFERWLSDPDSALLVAELDGQVRGVGKVARTGKLELCYVAPGFQGRAVGYTLLQALEARARAWQLPELRLDSSLAACAFYARSGYEAAGPPTCWLGSVRGFPFRKQLRAP